MPIVRKATARVRQGRQQLQEKTLGLAKATRTTASARGSATNWSWTRWWYRRPMPLPRWDGW